MTLIGESTIPGKKELDKSVINDVIYIGSQYSLAKKW